MKQEIIDLINDYFSKEKRKIVTQYLSSINLTHVMAESEYNLENTLLSILYLANGNIDSIIELTECAKIDFRDVILWAQQKKNLSIMYLPKTKDELLGTYYLKSDLINLCKTLGLPSSGTKENLLGYIINYMDKKHVKRIGQKSKIVSKNFEIAVEQIIDINYSNNEIHKIFFKNMIGDKFKFNVKFMKWMDKNKGKKTYREAIEIYNKILLEKKSGKKEEIGKQFKYNQYTRDFFKDNPNLSKNDCIKCWNYKKKLIGDHK